MTILNKICATFGISYGDIIEYVDEDKTAEGRNDG